MSILSEATASQKSVNHLKSTRSPYQNPIYQEDTSIECPKPVTSQSSLPQNTNRTLIHSINLLIFGFAI